MLFEDSPEILLQVNADLRDVIKVPANANQAAVEAAVKAAEKARQFIADKTIRKVIVVPKKPGNITGANRIDKLSTTRYVLRRT